LDDQIYDQLYAVEDSHWWFRGRRAVIWALLRHARLAQPARLLDAGCGTGRNVQEFAPLGEVVGIEPSPAAVEFCHRRGLANVQKATIERLPFDAASFDAAFVFDVLEHVDDDITALRELHRVAKPGAWLVATVPAYRWLWSQHDESHHHRRRYTRTQLTAHAVAAGWQPLFATYFNTILLPPIAAVRALHRFGGRSPARTDYELTTGSLNRILGVPMQMEARAIARGVRLPAGVSIGMVCTTP